jgi:hypothetical protein
MACSFAGQATKAVTGYNGQGRSATRAPRRSISSHAARLGWLRAERLGRSPNTCCARFQTRPVDRHGRVSGLHACWRAASSRHPRMAARLARNSLCKTAHKTPPRQRARAKTGRPMWFTVSTRSQKGQRCHRGIDCIRSDASYDTRY